MTVPSMVMARTDGLQWWKKQRREEEEEEAAGKEKMGRFGRKDRKKFLD